MAYMAFKTKINGVTILIEPELSGRGVCVFGVNKDNVKDGVSIHYMKTQFGKLVPVNLQVYNTGICDKSYEFDCITGLFTQFVDFSNGCKLVAMDKRAINKHKNDADNYYKQANNLLNNVINKSTKSMFMRTFLYNELGIR